MSKNVRILYNLCFTCLFLTLCNLSNCSLIHAFHSVDRWWVPPSELNSIQYVAFSISCSWDTVVIVLCVAPYVVNPQYVSSNSWALIVLGAESDTGEATPRLPTQIICGWLQIWNGVRFIAPPLIIPPSPQNTCIIAVAFLLTLSSATFASQTVTLCIHLRPFPALLFTLFVIQENVSLHWNEIKGEKITHLSSQHQWKYRRPCAENISNINKALTATVIWLEIRSYLSREKNSAAKCRIISLDVNARHIST